MLKLSDNLDLPIDFVTDIFRVTIKDLSKVELQHSCNINSLE